MTALIGIVAAACLLWLCVLVGMVWLAKQSGLGLLGLLILSFCAVADRQRKTKLHRR
jgi:hypothetical protein